MELAGKTMGIIGYGRIGQSTGRIAQALGMNVLACDAYKRKMRSWKARRAIMPIWMNFSLAPM